jgi:spore coat protein CotH
MFKPQTHEKDPAVLIWGPIEEMIQSINEAPDPLFVQDVSRYLDLWLFTRYIAVEDFLAEGDGVLGGYGLNNFYLYRFERSTRSQFLPWDKDNAFISTGSAVLERCEENVLARRTLADPRFMQTFLDTLIASADSADEPDPDVAREPGSIDDAPTPGWLEREVTREYEQVRAAVWADSQKPFSSEEFEEAVQIMLDFARGRSAFVRQEVQRLQRTLPRLR